MYVCVCVCANQFKTSTSPPPVIPQVHVFDYFLGSGVFELCLGGVGNLNQNCQF